MGEPLKILQVTKGSNFINFFYAEAHHHLLDVGNPVLSVFHVFFISFFFQIAYCTAPWLELWLESLFGIRRAAAHHVPGLLAIEALAFFGKLVSFFGCELLELSINGVGLYFCSIYIYGNVL